MSSPRRDGPGWLRITGLYVLLGAIVAMVILGVGRRLGLPVPDTGYYTLIAVILTSMAIMATGVLPRHWRGEVRHAPGRPPWWLWGGPAWRALTRPLLCGIVGCLSIVLGMAAFGSTSVVDSPGTDAVLEAVGLGFFAIFVLAALVGVSVGLFNRPKALVAPHRRDERGALPEWSEQLARYFGLGGRTP